MLFSDSYTGCDTVNFQHNAKLTDIDKELWFLMFGGNCSN